MSNTFFLESLDLPPSLHLPFQTPSPEACPFIPVCPSLSSHNNSSCPTVLLVIQYFPDWPLSLGAELTSVGGCHLTGDAGHIAVSASPPRRTQTPRLCFILNAGAFVFTGRPTTEVHQGLKQRQTHTSTFRHQERKKVTLHFKNSKESTLINKKKKEPSPKS